MRTSVIEKLNKFEREVKILKRTLLPEVDFEIDEKNWKGISKELKRSRAKVFRKVYGKIKRFFVDSSVFGCHLFFLEQHFLWAA
jgi:hypothetical protein